MMKRMLSLLLCLVMVLSMVPVQAIAQENEAEPTEMISETEAVEPETEPTEEETAPTEETTAPIETVLDVSIGATVPSFGAVENLSVAPMMKSGCADGHTREIVSRVDSTCTEQGWTEGVRCSVCGASLEGMDRIPEKDHDYSMGTCLRCGDVDYTCGENLRWAFDEGILTIWGTGDMYDYNMFINVQSPWTKHNDDISEIVFGDDVTHIGSGAFEECAITDINIPEQITRIDAGAFWNCKNLKTVNIWADDVALGASVFEDCINLEKVTFHGTVKTVGTGAFRPYSDDEGVVSSLKEVVFEKSVDTIDHGAFSQNNNLSIITFRGRVKTVGESAFSRCEGLKEVIFTDGVETIGESAFGSCENLETVTIPIGYVSLSNDTFSWCKKLKNLDFQDRIISLGERTFALCHSLESMNVSDYVEEIPYGAFLSCLNLKTVKIGDGVKIIEEKAFSGCWLLEYVFIGKTVEAIEENAFHFCASLSNVDFTGNAPDFANNVFAHVTTTAYYPCGNPTWTDEVMQNYGGTITWRPCCFAHNFDDWFMEGNQSRRTCTLCGYTEHKINTDSGDIEIAIPEQPDLEVETDPVLPSEDKYILIEEVLDGACDQDYAILKVFDITLKNADGVHVQPNGTVNVKLPLDWNKDGHYKVFRINDDRTLTDMQAYRQGSHMVFETDHFSLYLIVEEEHQPEVAYTYGQNVQIKLIEPWGIRANAKISTSAGVVDYDSLYDYGVYFIRKSALDREGLTQENITVDDILNDADAVRKTKANGVTISGDYLSAIYDSDIYTYELDDSVFVMFYFVTEEGADPIYVPVRERNLKTLAQQRMNDAASFPNDLERDVYKKMVTLEADVTDYRSDFTSLSTPEMQKAPTLAQYPLGAAAASSSYTYGQNAQIKLIEPWGLKANVKVSYNGSVIDYSTVEEYGMVVLADNSKVYNDASEILRNENAYVFSSKNGDASIGGQYISATYSKDIYTYQLNTDIYVFGYVKDADGYHYGPVRNRNVHDLMIVRKDDAANFPNGKERTVYADMIDLYTA